MINTEKNIRRNFTLPTEIYERLQRVADQLSAEGPGKVAVSDLILEGAKKVLQEREKPLA